MSRPDAAIARLVRQRGAGFCEYCHFPESLAELPFQLDHIIARKHLGETTEANLAFACYHCNSAKGPNIAGIDPISDCISPLFHPRLHVWGSISNGTEPALLARQPRAELPSKSSASMNPTPSPYARA